jgi:lipoprotein signal peptidase
MNTENQSSKNVFEKKKPLTASFFFLCAIFIFFVAIDQFSKHLAFESSGNFRNYAFAFSLPLPSKFIYLTYAVIIAATSYYCFKNYKKLSFISRLAWVLIFAGAFSNIAERIVLGYVRDFIYIAFYKWLGIYNAADFFILSGIIMLLLPQNINRKKQ